ncbi:MAG: FAD-dependent oxidoreductase [Patescibacteria group bacterium]
MPQQVDLAIIGGGPAGLTAALYAARRTLSTLVITKDIGGQMATTPLVENYPGIDSIDGLQLSLDMQKQAEKYGARVMFSEVKHVEPNQGEQKNEFLITTAGEPVLAKAIVLTFGVTPRKLNVPGEDEYYGKGVSYCATCDAPLYKNKIVVVVGGGNAALEAAEIISRVASKTYLIHRRDQFRAEEITLNKVRADAKIEIRMWSEIREVKGEKTVKSIMVEQTQEKRTEEISVDGVFVEIGRVVQSEWIKNLVELNEAGEILANPKGETRTPGLFAAGDVTSIPQKQIVASAGQGCIAALSAYEYILKLSGQEVSKVPDWSIKQK